MNLPGKVHRDVFWTMFSHRFPESLATASLAATSLVYLGDLAWVVENNNAGSVSYSFRVIRDALAMAEFQR
jgi:hypothetical protein